MFRKGEFLIDGFTVTIVVILLVALFANLVLIGYDAGEKSVREKAIKEGVGEYYTPDPTKPNLEFRFKTPAPQPEAH